ncbi:MULTISPECIES: hypothetical protein [Sphingomonas]|uniref:hypothetical protein n=1 Tax=Sphingomonas TaxID=13687 RepID=UPI000DEED88E|nr:MULTISPECIES: hypothetical protein [Sphingomonas]
MFKYPTVFVIGAGASAEVNMPVGNQLAVKISELLNFRFKFDQIESGDPAVFFAARAAIGSNRMQIDNEIYVAGNRVSQALVVAPSIDTFVENFSHDQTLVAVSKLGIAKAILQAEKGSALFANSNGLDLRRVRGTWFASLAEKLFSGVSARDIKSAFKNVTFVTFNYDRCLELFLHAALIQWFGIDSNEARDVLSGVRIYHPYGRLGSIWATNGTAIPFGGENVELREVADGLMTYSESTRDAALAAAIHHQMREARNLIYLGFAFHEPNMQLLTVGRHPNHPFPRIIASTYGFSKPDTAVIEAQIADVYGMTSGETGGMILTHAGKCVEIFNQYGKTMMVAA